MSSKTATYRPTENEPYMGKKQLKYFREKLRRLEGRDPSGQPRDDQRHAGKRGADPGPR